VEIANWQQQEPIKFWHSAIDFLLLYRQYLTLCNVYVAQLENQPHYSNFREVIPYSEFLKKVAA
jgi:hypothetical protein